MFLREIIGKKNSTLGEFKYLGRVRTAATREEKRRRRRREEREERHVLEETAIVEVKLNPWKSSLQLKMREKRRRGFGRETEEKRSNEKSGFIE